MTGTHPLYARQLGTPCVDISLMGHPGVQRAFIQPTFLPDDQPHVLVTLVRPSESPFRIHSASWHHD